MNLIPKRSHANKLASLALRVGALGGRFVFILFAAQHMTPTDFGIYGIIASSSYLINQLVGLEAYQTTLRHVALDSEQGRAERPAYGRFVLLSTILSALSGAAMAAWFGWSFYVIPLAGTIIASEYVGTEVTRILVAENRSISAQISVSLRFAPWSFAWPLVALAGLAPTPWPLLAVLSSWLTCSVIGNLFVLPIINRYLAPTSESFFHWYGRTLAAAPRWLLVALCWRFLETGIRLVPAVLIDEATAGRYVFFANLASIGTTGLKAAIEPLWYVRMIRPTSGAQGRREFAFVSLAWVIGGTALSFAGLWSMQQWGHRVVTPYDWSLLAALCVSAGFISMSQVPHYALYAAHADAAIFRISIFVLVGSVVSSFALTAMWGLTGTAVAAVLGGAALAIAKLIASRRLPHQSA